MSRIPQQPLIIQFAVRIGGRLNSIKAGDAEWENKWTEKLEVLGELLPSGSGFNMGTTLDQAESTPDRIVFTTAFCHMNENGFEEKMTVHDVIVTPSFIGMFDIEITGEDYNDIKTYILDKFHSVLSEMHDQQW